MRRGGARCEALQRERTREAEVHSQVVRRRRHAATTTAPLERAAAVGRLGTLEGERAALQFERAEAAGTPRRRPSCARLDARAAEAEGGGGRLAVEAHQVWAGRAAGSGYEAARAELAAEQQRLATRQAQQAAVARRHRDARPARRAEAGHADARAARRRA